MNANSVNWSPQQKTFLDWCEHGTGSCVLIAVAGAGKTTVAIEGARLLRGGVAMMAFNKKIAEEIKARLVKAGMDWKKAQGGTAHSFGFGAFRKAFPNVKIDDRKVAKIIESIVAHEASANLDCFIDGIAESQNFVATFAPVIEKLVGFAKQAALGVIGSIDDQHRWLELINHYDVWSVIRDGEPGDDFDLVEASINVLKRSNADTATIDFDDMIYLPLFHRVRFWQFDNVIIDEAQDTNAARRALARVMLKKGGRLIAIGDPAQAINGFAGADNDALDQIKREFKCIELPLTVSFRCPKKVVAYAQRFASHIQAADGAIDGEVYSADVDSIFKGKITLTGKDAILCRNTKPLVTLAMKLIRNKIGCKIEGKDIGIGLKNLAHRWSRINSLDGLRDALEAYLEKQRTKLLAKKQEARFAALEDQVECLQVIIAQCKHEGGSKIADVDAYLDTLFGDDVNGVACLSTIHKSKGREWNRVFWLNRETTCPSKWARQDWEHAQENNLQYVCATRAQGELVNLTMPEEIK